MCALLLHEAMPPHPAEILFAPGPFFFLFFNDTAPTETSPLPLHDALPIYQTKIEVTGTTAPATAIAPLVASVAIDRKSTRLNSSHVSESRMPSSALKK